MRFRFADLPVSTKFLVTLAIPVLGLVLLLGKEVDSSLKRRNVLGYINAQTEHIAALGNMVYQLQQERALGVAYLCRVPLNERRLDLENARTEEALNALRAQASPTDHGLLRSSAFDGIEVLRARVRDRRTDAPTAERMYRALVEALLKDLGALTNLPVDIETKDRLYAHLSLVNASAEFCTIRNLLLRLYANTPVAEGELAGFPAQLSAMETNLLFFERDALPEVLDTYRRTYQGANVNTAKTAMNMLRERAGSARRMPAGQWWNVGSGVQEQMRHVEESSIDALRLAATQNAHGAERRLLLVLAALLTVVVAVGTMTFVIVRELSRTVSEVTRAAYALSQGDVSAKVPVRSADEIGGMVRSFNRMMDHVRSLATAADSIGKGNYGTMVDVRGQQDVLGHALTRMKDNLLAARLRDLEQNSALKAEKEKLQEANERIKVLIKEIHHRVKNNLQVIVSLLRLQAASIDDERLRRLFGQSQSRVASMALIHERLYKGEDLAQVDVANYLQELFAELVRLNEVHAAIRCETDIEPDLQLGLDTMVPLSLIVNELITNSFKHAFAGRDHGTVEITVKSLRDGDYGLFYSDDGVGMGASTGAQADTLGVSLIVGLAEQLNGTYRVESDLHGTHTTVTFRPVRDQSSAS
jgi:two-component sensor histidine kinase/HAMP domain-containing protein